MGIASLEDRKQWHKFKMPAMKKEKVLSIGLALCNCSMMAEVLVKMVGNLVVRWWSGIKAVCMLFSSLEDAGFLRERSMLSISEHKATRNEQTSAAEDEPVWEPNAGRHWASPAWWWWRQGRALGESLQQLEKCVLIRLVGWWFPKQWALSGRQGVCMHVHENAQDGERGEWLIGEKGCNLL